MAEGYNCDYISGPNRITYVQCDTQAVWESWIASKREASTEPSAIRDAALEEAAAVCQDQYEFVRSKGRPELGSAVDDALKRIRALKGGAGALPDEARHDKLLTIIAHAYQIMGAHNAPAHVLDVLADPEAATAEQIDAILTYEPADEAKDAALAESKREGWRDGMAEAQELLADEIKDAERLSWLEQNHAQTYRFESTGTWRISDVFSPIAQASTLREAIDAAIAQSKAGEGQA